MKFIARTVVTAFAIILVAKLIPGIEVENLTTAILAALLLAILNAIVRPLFIILTLPITIVTLGLFIFFINAWLFLAVGYLIDGFAVSGFLPALLGSVIVSIVSSLANKELT